MTQPIQVPPDAKVALNLPAHYVQEIMTGLMERPKRIADVVIAEIEKQMVEQFTPREDVPAAG